MTAKEIPVRVAHNRLVISIARQVRLGHDRKAVVCHAPDERMDRLPRPGADRDGRVA
jgi:hypothetical protein